jgi:hypothetical protein
LNISKSIKIIKKKEQWLTSKAMKEDFGKNQKITEVFQTDQVKHLNNNQEEW